jgi:hypothetical protein
MRQGIQQRIHGSKRDLTGLLFNILPQMSPSLRTFHPCQTTHTKHTFGHNTTKRKHAQVAERVSALLVCPSDFVQTAVANGLASAISVMGEADAKAYADKFLAGHDDPRGSGYGLAGVVKGLKTRSLRTLGILSQLDSMANDKKDQKKREAAMAAYECLATVLVRIHHKREVAAPRFLLYMDILVQRNF